MLHELFHDGGPIVWVLFGLSILALGIVIAKIVLFVGYRRSLRSSREFLPEGADPERLLALEALRLARGLTTLRIIGGSAPLLGLLGTVLGLFQAFKAVASQGLGDPQVFADGIALALTTTIAGLLVALPSLAAHQYLTASVERTLLWLESRLDEAAAVGPRRSAARGATR